MRMFSLYDLAGRHGHRFYLPYLKIAKSAHAGGQYEKAARNFATGIDCLLEMEEKDRDETILGSTYTNLTSALTMLHRYEAAEKAWLEARKYPQQPGADATGAILYAAMGNADQSAALIRQLKKTCPQWVAPTEEMIKQILQGTHPVFPREG